MNGVLRQVVGIDVAKNELVVSLARTDKDCNVVHAQNVFPNTKAGFNRLLSWTKKNAVKNIPVRFVMEATGVYHESFAYYLDDKKQDLSIVLPNKISNYTKTLDIKTVTDKTSSMAIALFGLERKLTSWHKPKPVFVKLRQLTREREQIVDDKSSLKCQLHAEETTAAPNASTIKRTKVRIALLAEQELAILKELKKLISEDKELKARIARILTIHGVGLITAVTVLAETHGFDLIRSKRQLASYAGFDVREKTSGISVSSPPRISKRGNKHLRAAMHMPSLKARNGVPELSALYDRLMAKHGIKMKALVAVQRRLLELIYAVDKSGKAYDKNYHKTCVAKQSKANEELAYA